MYLTPQALRASSPERGAKGAPRFVAEASGRVPSPRRALPLLGEVPSAHTGERGLRGRLRCRREKTERGAEYSFPHRQSHSHGDPSVSLTLDSSPKRGAKGVDSAPAPQGAAPFRGSPQCAHWGKGSPGSGTVQSGKDRTQCRQFFSPVAIPQPWRPLSLACARQLP